MLSARRPLGRARGWSARKQPSAVVSALRGSATNRRARACSPERESESRLNGTTQGSDLSPRPDPSCWGALDQLPFRMCALAGFLTWREPEAIADHLHSREVLRPSSDTLICSNFREVPGRPD